MTSSITYSSSALQDSSRSALASATMPLGMAGSMNILGKPMATNNFVTKLYQQVLSYPMCNFTLITPLLFTSFTLE